MSATFPPESDGESPLIKEIRRAHEIEMQQLTLEFKKRGIVGDRELEIIAQDPANLIGIQSIGVQLGLMAQRLKMRVKGI